MIPRTTKVSVDVDVARLIARRDMFRAEYDRQVEESRKPLPSGRYMTIIERCQHQASAWDNYFAAAQAVGVLLRNMKRAA